MSIEITRLQETLRTSTISHFDWTRIDLKQFSEVHRRTLRKETR